LVFNGTEILRAALRKSSRRCDRKNGFEIYMALQLAKLKTTFSVKGNIQSSNETKFASEMALV
jgi:hypothetical protein